MKRSPAPAALAGAFLAATSQIVAAEQQRPIGFSGKVAEGITLACRDSETYARILNLVSNDDAEAARKLIRGGNCIGIAKGQLVTIRDKLLILDCLRPQGDPDCYWTYQSWQSE